MSGPGFSLFDGNVSFQIDTSEIERRQQADEEEDRIRLQAELQDEMLHAFDDLDAQEDDTSLSSNFEYDLNPGVVFSKQNGVLPLKEIGPKAAILSVDNLCEEVHHLKLSLESKTREFKHVTGLLDDERRTANNKIAELNKRVGIAEAEKIRANITRQETHELLIDSKTKYSDLNDKIGKLENKIKSLEVQNTELTGTLEHTRAQLSESNNKCYNLERTLQADRDADKHFQQTAQKYNGQITLLEQQLTTTRSQLADKEHQLKNLDVRYNELQRSRESLLIEKAETINQLNAQLEETQRQCHQQQQSSSVENELVHENTRLQRLVQNYERQSEDMQTTCDKLTERLEAAETELNLLNNVLMQGSKPLSSKLGIAVAGSTPLRVDECQSKLKTELYQSLNGQRLKRAEILRLQEKLNACDAEIKKLHVDENRALIEVTQFREENSRLSTKLRLVEQELVKKSHSIAKVQKSMQTETSRTESTTSEPDNIDLRQSLETEKHLLRDAQSECERYQNLYTNMSCARDLLSQEVTELRTTNENLQKSLGSLEHKLTLTAIKEAELTKLIAQEKAHGEERVVWLRNQCDEEQKRFIADMKASKNASTACAKCIDQMTRFAKLEIENLHLENMSANQVRTIADLKLSLERTNAIIADNITLTEERESLIRELKTKATQFEEFMAQQVKRSNETAMRDACTSPYRSATKDQAVSVSIQDREAMAKFFASELKVNEAKFKRDLSDLKAKAEQELDEVRATASARGNEVSILKQAILSERLKMHEILSTKEDHTKTLFDKQNSLLASCRKEVDVSKTIIAELKQELVNKNEQILKERKSIAVIEARWEQERLILGDRERELRARLTSLDDANRQKIDLINDKYRTAKKTALSYKKYSEDKEKHMRAEYERIREGYTHSVDKVEKRLKSFIDNNEKNITDKIVKLEQEYATRLQALEKSQTTSSSSSSNFRS